MQVKLPNISDKQLKQLAVGPSYRHRLQTVVQKFYDSFGQQEQELYCFSAPGRIEIGGNHTDHQNGCTLSASINRDVLGVAVKNDRQMIRLYSEGYQASMVSLDNLSPVPAERGQSPSLIRGVADGFERNGYHIGGFDAYVSSDVLIGSGLSSSASFEMWLATAINHLFNGGEVPTVEVAKMGQYAENKHFGKPCGLQDQMASAIGGTIFIDFGDSAQPQVQQINTPLEEYSLCVIDSGAHHADLTHEYTAIREEMQQVAAHYNQGVLRKVDEHIFMQQVSTLREALGDRPVLRAYHFFAENKRAQQERDALLADNLDEFLALVNESGRSSFMYLQNVIVPGNTRQQELATTLALCDHFLGGEGAFRMQGGGFGGTVEVFVPDEMLPNFKANIEQQLGKESCQVLAIRPVGATQL